MIEGHGSLIRAKGDAVMAALIRYGSRKRAAAEAGVSIETVKHWLADADYAEQYATAKRQCVEEAQQALVGSMLHCISYLDGEVQNEGKPDSHRRACAYALLTLAKGVLEGQDLADRLAKLEVTQELLRHELSY